MKNTKIFKKGFTLLELLVVVAIVGLFATIVVAALGNARNKGGDAGVKANLKNAVAQGEIYYGTNTVNPNSYLGVCGLGSVGTPPVGRIGDFVLAAAKANGYTGYDTNNSLGSTTDATCNESANGWAAEVPLKSAGSGQMWCVDWTGKSKQEGSSIGAGVLCN